jgi:hypothetical protein
MGNILARGGLWWRSSEEKLDIRRSQARYDRKTSLDAQASAKNLVVPGAGLERLRTSKTPILFSSGIAI